MWLRRILGASVVLVGAYVALAGSTAAAPTSFQLVFDGRHTPAAFPSLTGLQHEGPFSGAAPFCASGYGVDISQPDQSALRRFTCSDGTGSFDAIVGPLPAEHGGTGNWRIVAGTEALSKLRGRGTWTSALVAGDPSNPTSVEYRSTWQGVADLDDSGPTIAVSRARAKKLRRPARTYTVTVAFTARDETAGNRVSFVATAQVGSATFSRAGANSTGSAAVSFRFRAPKTARAVRIRIRATDPVGNERGLTRSVRLPSR